MFELFISDVSDFLSIKNQLESKKLSIEEVNINRFMLHLLSSGKLFVDFNENQIKRKYSKNSVEFEKYIDFQVVSMMLTLHIDFVTR